MNNHLDMAKFRQHDAMQASFSFLEGTAAEKIEFLGSMGHELRNPLANVIAQVETLLAGVYGPLPSAQENAMAAIRDSTQKMLRLITDLVDVGRIEAGVTQLAPMPCQVRECCENSKADTEVLARSRSIQVVAEVQPRDLGVMADARRLEQIITELLAAGLLTMKTGGLLRLTITHDEGWLVLQTQSGAGQAAVQDAPAQILGRLGKIRPIGLALLQKLVKVHGGTFVLNEMPEQEFGMCIRVALSKTGGGSVAAAPAGEPEAPASVESGAASAPAPGSGARKRPLILIADDQPALIAVTRNYFESLGFEVETAQDGSEAVSQACTLKPDLILMDVRMPVVDGLSAIREIRSSADPRTRDIAIVSLSGHATASDKERCLAAGASAYLNKPFGIRELDRIISEFLRPAAS